MPKKTDTLKQTTQRRQTYQTAAKATRITPMQRELLDMFAHRELSTEEILELKDILSNYFLEKAQDELEALARESNWDLAKKSEEWGKDKLRTPYRRDRRP